MPVQFIGKSTFVIGTGSVTQTFPTYAVGDLLLLVFNSANQAPPNNPTAKGYTLITSISTGTAAAAGGNIVYAWYKFATASETAHIFGDAGSYGATMTFSFRGVDTSTPFVGTTTTYLDPASTSFTTSAITTTQFNACVVHIIGFDADANSTAAAANATNANLTDLTIQHAQTGNAGVGGGIGLITGFKELPGSTGVTTGTTPTNANNVCITIALGDTPDIRSGTGAITHASTVVTTGAKQRQADAAISNNTSTVIATGNKIALATGNISHTTSVLTTSIKYMFVQAELSLASAVSAVGGVNPVLVSLDNALTLRVLNMLIESDSSMPTISNNLTVYEFIEGSEFAFGPDGKLTAALLIEGEV